MSDRRTGRQTNSAAIVGVRGIGAGVVAIDQAVSSATNLLYMVAASVLLSGDDFGAFALGSSVSGVALGVARTTSSERLALVRAPRTRGRAPMATLSLVGIALVATCAMAVLYGAVQREVVVVWLVALPLILFQDRLRYVAMLNRAGVALGADLAWFVVVAATWLAVQVGALDGPQLAVATALIAGSAVSTVVLLIGVSGDVAGRVEDDRRVILRESGFVADSWLLSTGVFVSLAIVATSASLTLAGQTRILFLFFQPFVSLAYAGRWAVLRSRSTTSRSTALWPLWLPAACTAYALTVGVAWKLGSELDLVPSLWRVGLLAFTLNAGAQIARSAHQAMADTARRVTARGLVPARVLFVAVLLALIQPFTVRWGLDGVAAAYLVAFTVGAADVHRRTRARRLEVG